MSNTTAAGPSRGILDLIFGSKAEAAPADGQSFGGLMDLIKALKEKKEELSAEMSRTSGETTLGKNGNEMPVVGMPGMNTVPDSEQAMMASAEDQEKKDRLARLSMLLGQPMAPAVVQPQLTAPEAIQPEQVNQALQQKALPPLSSQEMKLLGEVNKKLEQANATQPPLPAPALFAVPKGIDSSKLKSAELSAESGAPEKIVSADKLMSTETYLKMHEGFQKAPAKEVGERAVNQAAAGNPLGQASSSLTATAIAGTSQKGLGAKGKDAEELPEGQAKLDATSGGAFGSLLAQQSGETMRHDIYLPGKDKPEELRRALVGEVETGVALHAGKGGGEMRLVLHPDDMGEVKLKVATKNGKVEVEVVAENEATAKLIRSGSKELEQSLKDQNLSLARLEVTVSDPSTVNSLDTKTSLTDQFLSQNQQQLSGFSAGTNGDEGRNSRWTGEHGGRPYAQSEDSGRGSERAAAPRQIARDSSRRLDVVA